MNPETIRSILRKYNYHGKVARNKPFISKKSWIHKRELKQEFGLLENGYFHRRK